MDILTLFYSQDGWLQKPVILVTLITLVLFLVFVFVRWTSIKILQKISSLIERKEYTLPIAFIKSIHYSFLFLFSFFIAIHFAAIDVVWMQRIYKVFLFIATVQVVISLKVFIGKTLIHMAGNMEDPEDSSFLQNIGGIISVFLWVVGFLFLLVNYGYNINSLITGFGIGGVVVAFALQNTLADLFSAFSIYFDKPFKNGDFIVFGSQSGTVIKTGFKSTRIRTLRGEELVVGNQQILKNEIQNFHDMRERRVSCILRIRYQSSYQEINLAREIIEKAVTSTPNTRLDRVHFIEIGEYSLNFELVYYVLSGEYLVYVNCQQEINIKILRDFEEAGIEFAIPEQNLVVEQNKENQKT